jgi:hypothetical protein
MTGHNKNLAIKHTGNSVLLVLALLFAALPGLGQTPGKAPTLTMATVPLVTAQRAEPTMVNLNFRVPEGYHINSSTPKSEFLIPTALKMDLPTDIILGKIEYPAGEDRNFPLLARRKAECVQRGLYHRRRSPSAAFSRARKIRDARSSSLPGLRQRRLLPTQKSARKFRSEGGERTGLLAPVEPRAKPTRAQLARDCGTAIMAAVRRAEGEKQTTKLK